MLGVGVDIELNPNMLARFFQDYFKIAAGVARFLRLFPVAREPRATCPSHSVIPKSLIQFQ